jgi:hypothetical protein
MESIDVTSLGDEILGINHGTFARQPSILNDVGILIESRERRLPHMRLKQLRGTPEGSDPPHYWRFAE